ncbi:MAG: recombination protein O N-terminal domain-containing protein [Candidatus Pacebacteria bacterium]|nr:recombination protein O N-terminal domain-containing protein [Candidatus Paceibacterota bacterium]
MFEAVTEAIVLDKIDQGEFDSRVYLYTKDFGRISAKITSSRKITSKLAGHFEPLKLVTARIIDKNGPLAVDGLSVKTGVKSGETVRIFSLVKELSAEGQRELPMWNFLLNLLEKGPENKSMVEALSLLGFDPAFARCDHCNGEKPNIFSADDLCFYCQNCASGVKLIDSYAI